MLTEGSWGDTVETSRTDATFCLLSILTACLVWAQTERVLASSSPLSETLVCTSRVSPSCQQEADLSEDVST